MHCNQVTFVEVTTWLAGHYAYYAKKWNVHGAMLKCNPTRQDCLCNKPTGPVQELHISATAGLKKHLKSYTPAPAPLQELNISVTGLLKTSEIICT